MEGQTLIAKAEIRLGQQALRRVSPVKGVEKKSLRSHRLAVKFACGFRVVAVREQGSESNQPETLTCYRLCRPTKPCS